MSNNILFKIIFIIASLVFSGMILAADFSARLDRNRIVEGDPVVLTLSASGDTGGTPDFSALQQDFDLVRQGQSNHMSFVNGRSSSRREWHLTLMPRRSGTLTVPAIPFGSLTSRPLTLEVLPPSQAAAQGIDRPVLFEVEVQPEVPYVQQKITYTVRLLHAVPLRDGSLSEPQVSNALVQPLGKESRFETYRDGRQFQAIERRYAIIPQRSGSLDISGPVLTARVPEPAQQQGNSLRDRFSGRDPFAGLGGLFGQTRPIQLRARDLAVDVKAQPPGAPQPWLPAESLTVTEHWSPETSRFRVGEPITRTLVINATGLSDEQLPEPVFDAPNGVNVYPDRAQGETRPDRETLIAQKVIKAAFVPNREGEIVLPEIRIDWWDVAGDEPRVARVPARRFEVMPAAGVSPGSAAGKEPSPADSIEQAKRANMPSGQDSESVPHPRPGDASSGGYWPWLTALFALAWLVVTMLWLRGRTTPSATAGRATTGGDQSPLHSRNDKTILAGLRTACADNDARAARKALLDWAALRWPDGSVKRLDVLASKLGTGASDVFETLNSGLYAQSSTEWDGTRAWRQLQPLLGRVDAPGFPESRDDPLPPLYPRPR